MLLREIVTVNKTTSGNRFYQSAIPAMSVSLAPTRCWDKTSIAEICELTCFDSKASDYLNLVKKRGGFVHLEVEFPSALGITRIGSPKQEVDPLCQILNGRC